MPLAWPTKTTKDNPGVGYFDDSIYTEEYLSRLIRLSPPSLPKPALTNDVPWITGNNRLAPLPSPPSIVEWKTVLAKTSNKLISTTVHNPLSLSKGILITRVLSESRLDSINRSSSLNIFSCAEIKIKFSIFNRIFEREYYSSIFRTLFSREENINISQNIILFCDTKIEWDERI